MLGLKTLILVFNESLHTKIRLSCKTMKFTVHHTCSKQGGEHEVLTEFPFLSIYDLENDKQPFLGEGYYFWDFNVEYAKVWGKNHYANDYFVCESEIEIDHDKDGFYLDLAGNRKDLVGFVELLWEFNLIDEDGIKGIDLCWIIDYLRTQCPPEVFPFKVIRAVDYKNNERVGIKVAFNQRQKSFTILNPRIIIAFADKTDIVHSKKSFICFKS